jgi:hypothetical protein
MCTYTPLVTEIATTDNYIATVSLFLLIQQTYIYIFRFQLDFFMKMTVFGDGALCSLLETDRRFRGAYCLYYRPDDGNGAP